MPLARAAKSLKRLKKGNGQLLEKVGWIWVWRHFRLGLAPRPFGVGAAAALARIKLSRRRSTGS
jgi:hypothetical protein